MTITSKEVYTAFSIFACAELASVSFKDNNEEISLVQRGCNQSNLSSIICFAKVKK